MRSDTHADLVLDRFWDALIDDPMADSTDLDPSVTVPLRRLHAMASAPTPIESRERVRHRLNGLSGADHEHAAPPTDRPMPLLSLRRNAAAADGHLTTPTARSLATPQAIHGARRWTAILATAAIILLALAASIRSLGPGLLGDGGKVPAVPAPTTQSPDTGESLVAVQLTAEEAGFGGAFGTELGRFQVPPGSRDQWPGTNSQESEPRIVYIESGALRIRGDRSLRIVRETSGGVIEQTVPGTWFALGPGDTLLRVPEVNLKLENTGSVPAIVVDWTIGRVNQVITTEPGTWQQINYTTSGDGTAPTGPVLFRLRHVVLAPNSTLSAPTGAYFQQYLNLTPGGTNEIGQTSGFDIANEGPKPAELYIITLEPVTQTTEDTGSRSAPDETLLDVVLPEDLTSPNGQFISNMDHMVSAAGSHDVWSGPTSDAPEPLVWYVLSGTYTVRPEQDILVAKAGAGGTASRVAAGTETQLEPGDVLVRSSGVRMDLTNTGQEPVELVVWFPGNVFVHQASIPSSWRSILGQQSGTTGKPPTGPARLRLLRTTLEPDQVLPAPDGAWQHQALALDQQSPPIGQQSDFSLVNRGTEPVTLYVVSLEPAPDANDSANSASATEQTLLEVVLPKEQLQTPGRFNSIMGYYSVPAGSQDSWSGPTDNAPEPLVWHVLSGTYSVRANQDVQITRAGASGKTNVVAAGTDSTLGPGDALVRPAGALMELANDGNEPVLPVVWTLGDINVQGPSLPSSWDSLPCYPGETSGTTPTGPTRLQFRLVTIAPDATLSAPENAFVQQTLDLTQEAPNLGQKSDYSIINQGTEPVTLYVVSLEPASPDEATPVSST